jgi:hypothetical protein
LHVSWTLFEQLDRTRRLQGAMMDAAGLGPAETPYKEAAGELACHAADEHERDR